MASMVKKFRLAWISVSWPRMEGKYYFSEYMNPYAHTHLHAPRPQCCNGICSCAALSAARVVLNANQAHPTAQALLTQHFCNTAANAIQENSSVVQTKLGDTPSIAVNKIKLTKSQIMLQGLCAHRVSTFGLVGETMACAPHCAAEELEKRPQSSSCCSSGQAGSASTMIRWHRNPRLGFFPLLI